MDVIIDQVPVQFREEPHDLLDALRMVSDFLHERGRAVLTVRVDGRNVPSDTMVEALENKPITAETTLAVSSEQILVLVDNCLRELEAALPDLPEACHRLAEVFQGECPDAGYEPFQQLAGIWKTVKEREIQVLNALGLDPGALEINGVPLAQIHRELNHYIDEAAEAVRAGDCVLLGDLLEYELAPRAEMEAAIVALLRSRVQT